MDFKHKLIIDYHVRKYSGGDIPEAVLRSKAKIIYADTQKKYDPDKGDFETFLSKNLMGLNRFVNGSMQIRMPEHKQQQTRRVMDAIYNEYGDDDNIDFNHMSSVLNIKPKSIKSIYAGAKRTIVSDPTVEEFVAVDNNNFSELDTESLYASLPTQKHKDVYDYTMGAHGKPEIKTNGQIAMILGISESYVRKIKDEILSRIKDM